MKEFKGDLKGFPVEIVEKMLERQEEQGNERDIVTFEYNIYTSRNRGGFQWEVTEEGFHFWNAVLVHKSFDRFFEKYPKKPETIEESKLDEVTKAKLIYERGKEVIFDLDSTYIEDGMLIIKAK